MVYYTKFRNYSPGFEKIMTWLEKGKIFILILLIIFGLAYFWQINNISTQGFQMKELEKNIQLLKEENQKLELEAARQQSMLNIDEQVQELGLVAVDKVEYLRPVGPAVAVK